MSDSEYIPGEEKKHVKNPRKSTRRLTKVSSSEEEKYIVRPTRTRKPTKPSTPKVALNVIVLESSDEEKYTVKDTKSRQQPELPTLRTFNDVSNLLDSDCLPDEEDNIIKATNTRKPSIKVSSNKTSNKSSKKVTFSEPLATSNDSSNGTSTQSKRPVEKIYQKISLVEHILLRPDIYIGPTQTYTEKLSVYDSDKRAMVHRDVTYVPGLYKIINEILINAIDNKIRDPSMDTIKVDIDVKSGTISIYNNGDGIPVEIHKRENVYVPELLFGHLLTSSRYNDDGKNRNGYGAKLTNIFSTEFIVETTDSSAGKKYSQIFRDNMSVKESPTISPYLEKEEYTKITFKPDFQKFNMSNELDDDIIAVLKKRLCELTVHIENVYLNGERLKIMNENDK
ncbi:hypothetical protein RclHR1_17760001 [Rhizophagus clarus]|uniref:DNA topoisomerase (ATP-hydrolyzing) n=1 Tax=Rhizophagus clarus TaxID=94130 RepID=A0A2Z6QKY8_9GLOM|nr:hypothetical protein RclHR1_17760001 [Rhizophagus clarus]GES91574.1 DNA topoisomerase 2-like [Rhizophagus clarus]